MQVILWDNFSKKHNSTKIPQIAGTSKDMYMKEATSIENPTFIVNSNNFNYTYAYWNGHYYFVNDIVSVKDNLIAISCSQDVLATYREEILNTTQYIARSASVYNGNLIDEIATGTSEIIKVENTFNSPFETSGTYVLGVISKTSANATVGCVTYYALSSGKLAELMRFMLGDIEYMGIDFDSLADWTEQLFKGLINPFQYIVSCMYFPFEVPAGGTGDITFGFWGTTITVNYLGATITTFSSSVNIPKHPQTSARGNYLNLSPYANYMLNFTPFGNVPIDTHSIVNVDNLNLLTTVDLLTGEGILKVSDEHNVDIMTLRSQVGVPVQISQIVKGVFGGNVAGVATASLINSAINVYNSKSIEDVNIGSSTSSFAPKIMSSGTNGSRADYNTQSRNIVAEFTNIAPENIVLNGRPLLQNRQLRTLSGYTQCINPSVDINCLCNDRAEINSLLSSGFYIE